MEYFQNIDTDLLLNALATLYVTIDPPGVLPIFLALTGGMSAGERRSVAIRSVLIATVLLAIFASAGNLILETLGVTIHAFRIAGGLLLFYIAFEMIFEKRQERHEKTSKRITSEDIAQIAVFPLAIPLIAGPGSISAVILLSGQMGGGVGGFGLIMGVVICVMALLLVVFLAGNMIDRILGITGRMVLTRLMGVLLSALSVQFVIDGIKNL